MIVLRMDPAHLVEDLHMLIKCVCICRATVLDIRVDTSVPLMQGSMDLANDEIIFA